MASIPTKLTPSNNPNKDSDNYEPDAPIGPI
jgi:hypothetical protein